MASAALPQHCKRFAAVDRIPRFCVVAAKGNERLTAAFAECLGQTPSAPLYLFFSVNASGRFCG
eukprot:1180112-Prorocentrum_minimum.AAC.4